MWPCRIQHFTCMHFHFHFLTFVYERQSAILISSVGPGGVAGRVEVDHEVRLLPAVLLQSAPQLLVAPHCLQHQASPTHLPVRTVTGDPGGQREEIQNKTGRIIKNTLRHGRKMISYLSLLMSTSLSIPCEALRVLAASRLEPSTSWSVLNTDTTVASDSARTGWLWPPLGRLATRWGTACWPDNTQEQDERLNNRNTLLTPSCSCNNSF